jgi:hypothetical protein
MLEEDTIDPTYGHVLEIGKHGHGRTRVPAGSEASARVLLRATGAP